MEPKKSGASIKATSKQPTGNLSVHTFAEVEVPHATEDMYNEWITYGKGNMFPQEMILAWLQSPTQNALVNGIAQMIAGDGISFSKPELTVEAFRKKVNRDGMTLEDLFSRTAFDLYMHGYYGWKVVWNKARTALVEIYHVPAEQIRSGKADDEGRISNYYISWDWSQYRKEKFKPVRVKAFDLRDRSEGVQMMFVKQYRPSQYYYSTPSYFGGINWILMDNRIGEFHLNNIENGFFPSSVIQFFNGEPEQDAKRKLERGFIEKFTGKSQAKIAFVYNNNLDEKISFDTYEPANIDKRFKELMPEVHTNIMIAHRVPSPLLFGIRDGGGLGNNAEELESSSLLMNKMVIIPLQQIILRSLGEVFKINGWDVDITIETLQPAQFLDGQSDDADAGTEEESKFSKADLRKVLPDKMVKPILKHLDAKGVSIEDMEKAGWSCVMDDEDMTEEGIRHKLKPDMFSVDTSEVDPGEMPEDGFYLVRYQYRAGQGYQPIIDTTREFCSHMITSNGDKVYSADEIRGMDNEDFGSYDIFEYKGSYNCRHRWARMVWFRTASTRGAIPGYKLSPDDEVPLQFLPSGDSEATKVNERVGT